MNNPPNRLPNRANRSSPSPARRRQRKRKKALSTFLSQMAVFLFFFALLSATSAGLFFCSLTSQKNPGDLVYEIKTIEIVKEKPTEVSEFIHVPHETGFAYDQRYFPINGLMEKMGFMLFGDQNELTFMRMATDESVKFANGSFAAYINGEKCLMPGPAFAQGEALYVPLEFLESRFLNLELVFDEKDENKIAIDLGKIEIEQSCFLSHKAEMLPPVEESPEFGSYPVEFKSDISEYAKYFEPPAAEAGEYLLLINPSNPLDPQDYVPPDLTDLVDTRKDGRATQQLRFYPAMALEAFLAEARANGFSNITVTSAYRTYAYQSQLFEAEVAATGSEEAAAVSVARPGQSEHQSGLGVDMHNAAAANQNFGETPDGIWLAENAHHFGFILRYPADKTDITGIKYEPWHFRYVGRRVAAIIYAGGLCLEEYWEKYG